MMSRGLLAALVASWRAGRCVGYIWALSSRHSYSDTRLSFTEGYMFGSSSEGPTRLWFGAWGGSTSASYIDVDLECEVWDDEASTLSVLALRVPGELGNDLRRVNGCANESNPRWEAAGPFALASKSSKSLGEAQQPAAGTYYNRGNFSVRFDVARSNLQTLVIQVCSGTVEQSATKVALEGKVSFRNPSGYLPAQYFGYLPFEALLLAAYALALCSHVAALVTRQLSSCSPSSSSSSGWRPLDCGVVVALACAATEAAAWFGVYWTANAAGEPLCCPFEPRIVAAMAAHGARRLVTRVVLLCAASGLGTKVGMRTGAAAAWVALWATAYVCVVGFSLLAAIRAASEVEHSNFFGGSRDDTTDRPLATDLLAWRVLEGVLELVFLVWVYRAAAGTREFLKATSQTAESTKLRTLTRVLTVAIIVAGVYSAGVYASNLAEIVWDGDDAKKKYYAALLKWPYPLYWARDIQADLVTLLLLLTLAIVFRPSAEAPRIDVDRMVVGKHGRGGQAADANGAAPPDGYAAPGGRAADDDDDDDFDEHDDDDDEIPEDDSNRPPARTQPKPTRTKGGYHGLALRDEDEDDIEMAPKRD